MGIQGSVPFRRHDIVDLRFTQSIWHNRSVQTLCLKYRVFPSKEQERKLSDTLETCRLVYNSLVNDRVFQHETAKISVSRYEQQKMFPKWSKDFPEVKTVHSQVLQNVAVRVDLAFRAFFQRVKDGKPPGFPRLKGKAQYDSITYPQSGFKVGASSVWLSLQGKQTQVKTKIHRAIVGKVKTCTVRRYGSKWYGSKWFVCFSVEQEDSPLPPCAEAVGLDAGLNSFMALSNGKFIDNPRFFRRDEKALAKAGRKQSKTKERSHERRKANKVLSRIHERIRNRRHDFAHQTARKLVNKYGMIAVEKLNVKNLLGNHCLAKSISDASWSMFRSLLTSKAESAGREVIAVNPAYTSQDCSGCGYRPDGLEGRTKKKLSDRWHNCPMCTASLDRDTNAAINILNLALRGTSQAGITACQVTPVEAPAFTHGE
jgi:putative transposase